MAQTVVVTCDECGKSADDPNWGPLTMTIRGDNNQLRLDGDFCTIDCMDAWYAKKIATYRKSG